MLATDKHNVFQHPEDHTFYLDIRDSGLVAVKGGRELIVP